MAIKSSASTKPEFCHPSCNEHMPCGGKVCPYKVTVDKREIGSHSKGLETNGDIASEEDGSRLSKRSSSSRQRGGSDNVLSKAIAHLRWERSHTGNSDEGIEKADGLILNPDNSRYRSPKGKNKIEDSHVGQPQGAAGANEMIDKRFFWGVVSGISLAFGLPALILAVFYAARKVLLE